MSTEHEHNENVPTGASESVFPAPGAMRGPGAEQIHGPSAYGPAGSAGSAGSPGTTGTNGSVPLWTPARGGLQGMGMASPPSRSHGLNDPVTGSAPAFHPPSASSAAPAAMPALPAAPVAVGTASRSEPHPGAHPGAHPENGRGPSSQAEATRGERGEKVTISSVALNTPEDIELQKHITTRMAMLQRDPRYQKMQRTLASRRHLRSRLYEFTFLLDIGLSILALLMAQHYRAILGDVLHIDLYVPIYLYVHIFDVSDTVLLAVLVAVIWPIVFSRFRLYSTSWLADRYSYVRVIAAVAVSTLAASGMLYFLTPAGDRTRTFLIFFSVIDALLLVLSRAILRPLATARRLRRRVLVVGTGRLALAAVQSISERRRIGLEVVGVIGPERDVLLETGMEDEEEERASAKYVAWQNWRIGEIRDIVDIVQDRAVDLVLLALSPTERYETTWAISSVAHLPVQVYVVPDVVNETAKTAIDALDGMPLIGLAESGITGWSARAKRFLDLAISVPLVVTLWPLMLLIAVAVRLDSPGPAFFRQERIGQHNERFSMLKFRTMYIDAERRAREVAQQTARGLVHKRREDPRVTRLGRLLRRTSLDELPQLFNVIKGDMSIVGPRPELPWIVERYRAWQYRRLLVPQGITGWWQVHGRSDRVLHLHTQDDIFYVRNYSFWLDVKILLMTIKVVLTGRGAY